MTQKHSQARTCTLLLLLSSVGLAGLTGCLVREENHGHDYDRDHDRVIVEHHDDGDHRDRR